MANDTQSKVYEYIQKVGIASVWQIKTDLQIVEPNAVEQVVLSGLNAGKLELTSKGIRVPANA